jgi:hypothetical protein
MSNWSLLSSLRSFFTGSTRNIVSQGEFGSNAESLSKTSALASAFAGMNGADPNSGHLLPQQLLAPSPLVLPASGKSGFDQLSPPADVQTTSAMLAGGGGSSMTLPTTSSSSLGSTMVGAAGGLQFDLVWDSSVSSAPAGFKSAAIAAATYYTQMFSNPETITIDVGWGEVGGTAIGSGSLSESSSARTYEPYSAVRSALLKDAGQGRRFVKLPGAGGFDPAGDGPAGGEILLHHHSRSERPRPHVGNGRRRRDGALQRRSI